MYEDVRYKAFKEEILDIKVNIKTYITELKINEKFPTDDSTILSETCAQKCYVTKI